MYNNEGDVLGFRRTRLQREPHRSKNLDLCGWLALKARTSIAQCNALGSDVSQD